MAPRKPLLRLSALLLVCTATGGIAPGQARWGWLPKLRPAAPPAAPEPEPAPAASERRLGKLGLGVGLGLLRDLKLDVRVCSLLRRVVGMVGFKPPVGWVAVGWLYSRLRHKVTLRL